ncbi:MAG: endonuclease/exonuclease/phosphatase family protein [Spirochaetaceae bacterium]
MSDKAVVVVSVNIRFDAPEDGRFRWECRLPHLAAALLETEADVIGTQEGWHRQILDMLGMLPEYRLVDEHRNWDETKMYPCLFVRSGSIDVEWSRDIWLSRHPRRPGSRSFGSVFPRIMTLCRGTHTATNKKLLIGCLHLDNLSDRTRRKQAGVVVRELRKAGACEGPTLLLGDFNEAPSKGVHRLVIRKTPLVDPWQALELPEEPTFHGYGGATEPQRKRIDWILSSPEFEAVEGRRIDPPRRGDYLSDHHPVLLRFRMR